MSILEDLAIDTKRRERMNPLGKACFLDDRTLITIMAYNDMELMVFAVLAERQHQMPPGDSEPFTFFILLRAVKAFGNYRLAAIEEETCVDVLDNFDWISLKYDLSNDPEPAA